MSGTPLAAASLGLNYRIKHWYLGVTGNYYDRIYLSYSPNLRYSTNMYNAGRSHGGEYDVPEQAKGNGGFMLDANIGRQFTLWHNPLSINLQLCNLTNRRSITTGGYEQSRLISSAGKNRYYKFDSKYFYMPGTNYMLNLYFRF